MNIRDAELRVGQIVSVHRFGDFRIERVIGRGGMGTVYEVVRCNDDENEGITYAAKTVRPEHLQRPGMLDRFRRETAVLAKLRHENILKIHGLFWTSNTQPSLPLLFMDLLEGDTLRGLIDVDDNIPVHMVYSVAIGVLEALKALHKRGIVHRDVKPENIFLHEDEKSWRVLLMDFGIVKETEQAAAVEDPAGYFIGSMGYASPEQIMGREVTLRSDLYSVSVVLYELLVNRTMFPSAANPQSVGRAHLSQTPESLLSLRPDIPSPVSNMIMSGLAKRPEGRPNNAEAYLAPFVAAKTAMANGASPSTIELIYSNRVAGRPKGRSHNATEASHRGQTLRMQAFVSKPGPTRTVTAPNVPPIVDNFPPYRDEAPQRGAAPASPVAITLPSGQPLAPSHAAFGAVETPWVLGPVPASDSRPQAPRVAVEERLTTYAESPSDALAERPKSSPTDPTSSQTITDSPELARPIRALPRATVRPSGPRASRGLVLALIAATCALLGTVALVSSTWVSRTATVPSRPLNELPVASSVPTDASPSRRPTVSPVGAATPTVLRVAGKTPETPPDAAPLGSALIPTARELPRDVNSPGKEAAAARTRLSAAGPTRPPPASRASATAASSAGPSYQALFEDLSIPPKDAGAPKAPRGALKPTLEFDYER